MSHLIKKNETSPFYGRGNPVNLIYNMRHGYNIFTGIYENPSSNIPVACTRFNNANPDATTLKNYPE